VENCSDSLKDQPRVLMLRVYPETSMMNSVIWYG